jgi:hypothetical protein
MRKRMSHPFLGFLFLLSWAVTPVLKAQTDAPAPKAKKFTLSGYLKEKNTGESMIGASIIVPKLQTGAYTNNYGFYSITLPADTYAIVFSYIGFTPIRKVIKLDKDMVLSLDLAQSVANQQEVVIESKSETEAVERTQMSVNRLDIRTIQQIPAFFGEVDVIKAIQLLPGIKAGTEGSAGFFVRGGSNDQNLVMLDEAVIYNPAHMGGLFSVFNTNAVKGVEVFKGNFPAQYGGRLSSVLNVSMKEGNNRQFSMEGGLGIISSRFTIQGPIQKEKSSFIVSFRRTYFDLITRGINQSQQNNKNFTPLPNYWFLDLNFKANYQFNHRNQLYVSGYFGNDELTFANPNFSILLAWQNAMTSLRWNHLFSDKFFMNLTGAFTYYKYNIQNQFVDVLKANLGSNIADGVLKLDLEYFPNPRHHIRGGFHYTIHAFTPSSLSFGSSDGRLSGAFEQRIIGHEMALYVNHDWDISKVVKLSSGLRFSGFVGRNNKFYGGYEPRLALRIRPIEQIAIKLSYSRMYQYIHLVSSSTVTLPTDVWYPSTDKIPPQTADQLALGYTQIFRKPKLSLTIEGYYKWMHSLIEYKQNAQIFANPNLENEFTFGRGWSYGVEFQLERTAGKFTGWIGYTLAWTYRKFKDLNDGEVFPYRYDRRHDLSIVMNYNINSRWSIGATFIYRTGEAITLPAQRFTLADVPGQTQQQATLLPNGQFLFNPGEVVPVYGKRNSFRMPAYHRLDISVTYRMKPKRSGFESDLNLSIYNTYNNANPFFLYFDTKTSTLANGQESVTGFVGKIVSLFPVLPSLTWNFKFLVPPKGSLAAYNIEKKDKKRQKGILAPPPPAN